MKRQIVNPFSQEFWDNVWILWKDHRKEQDDFAYKGVISEQVALKHLVDLSEGDEEKASKIVFQSIERQWSGFYPLKQTSHGTRKKPTTKDGNAKIVPLRDRVSAAYTEKRNKEREQPGSESGAKAV